MTTKYRSIRVSNKLHNEVNEIINMTGFTTSKLLEMAWDEFKKSQKYERIISFCMDEKDDGYAGAN